MSSARTDNQNVWQKTFIEEEEWIKKKKLLNKNGQFRGQEVKSSSEFWRPTLTCVCGVVQTNAGSLSAAHGTTNTRNTCRGVVVGKGNVH